MRSTHRLPLLLSAGIAGLMLAAMPLGFDGSNFGPAQAWAGNASGHGQAGGHGNANADGHENHGSTAAGGGAANAANASDPALANASPDSRVGKIAALNEAKLAAHAAASYAEAAINEAQTALNQTVADAEADGTVTAEEQAAIDAAQDNLNVVTAGNEPIIAAAEQAQAEADAALADAGDKGITDEDGNVLTDIRDAVNNLLGAD
jgi:hypothetical protein